MPYQSTKTYGHDLGLSCCFRQWKAKHSHCQYLHGYALSVRLTFEANELDERNWVVDFGGLKSFKALLFGLFDHRTIVAADDPMIGAFEGMQSAGVLQVTVLDNVGCEAFARFIFDTYNKWAHGVKELEHTRLVSVEVSEHGANSAIYTEG